MQPERALGHAPDVSCPLCGATVPGPWRGGDRVDWWRCSECRFLFVHPQPDDETLDRLYEATYYAEPTDHSQRNLTRWRNRVMTIESATAPGRALDVGCGRGEFLSAALERGWEAWGTEVAESAVARLPDTLRKRVVVGGLPRLPFPQGSFDLITYFDVIEHVREPLRFLEWGRTYLRPDGLLVITTPDAGSLKAKLKGKRWKYLTFERYLHLYHFSAETLERAFQATGYRTLRWFRRRGTPLFVIARKI